MSNVTYYYADSPFPNNNGGQNAQDVTAELISRASSIPLFPGLVNSWSRREQVNNVDYFVIRFGEGDYIIDYSIVMRCNVIIVGEGVDKTKVKFTRSFNLNYRGQYCDDYDDAFLCVKGQKEREVSVEISNLTMQIAAGTAVNPDELHMVKLQHAHKVLFRNVVSRYDNLKAHNLDMRVCSNIVVENCSFTAYNNISQGAIMAIRGDTENVTIRNNSFHKHGNDEMLTFFGLIDDLNNVYIDPNDNTYFSIVPKHNFKRNILIEGNSFNYEKVNANPSGSEKVDVIDVVFSFYDFEHVSILNENNAHDGDFVDINCDVENVVVRNNHFLATEMPVKTWVSFSFTDFVTHRGIVVEDNFFMQGLWQRTTQLPVDYRSNISINDNSRGSEAILIRNNELWNKDISRVSYNNNVSFETRYNFLLTHGGNVIMEGNRIFDRATGENYDGMTLLYIEEQDSVYSSRSLYDKNEGIGMSVIMRDNHVEGLYRLAFIVRLKHPLVRIVAENNHIKGGCYLEVQDTNRIDVEMRANELYSSAHQLIYSGSPYKGNLLFDDNTVHNVYFPSGGSTPATQEFFDYYEDFGTGNYYLTPVTIDYLQMRNNVFVDFSSVVFNDTLQNGTRLAESCYKLVEDNEF